MKSVLKKKLNKKGFTLAELLVVVAIIAVLVAIAIPVFTSSLAKAEEGVEVANARATYAEGMVKVVDGSYEATVEKTYGNKTYKFTYTEADETWKVEVSGGTGVTVYNATFTNATNGTTFENVKIDGKENTKIDS